MSKIILLVVGILVVIAVGLFLVFGGMPTESGESRVGFSLREFLPFGNSDGSNANNSNNTNNDTPLIFPNTDTNKPIPRLRKISKEPIAGAVIFNIGSTSVVRFIEKGTGNVYEITSLSHTAQRLTNTTIPKIIRAFWLRDGSGFLAQTLVPESEIIETSFIKLTKNTATSSNEILTPFQTVLSKLPTGIKEVSIKPDGTKIFYYTINGALSNWFTSNPDGTGEIPLISHSLTEWLPKWTSGNTLTMQTKSSAESISYLYSFDVGNKTLKKLGFGVLGLSSNPSPDNFFTLISNGGSAPNLSVLDNSNFSIVTINTNSLADKCVWLSKEKSPSVYCAVPNQLSSGNYPDIWYQGSISTEDSLRKIDINNDIYYTLSDLSRESGEKIDVVDLGLPKDETHLVFKNKTDGYLWLLRIEE